MPPHYLINIQLDIFSIPVSRLHKNEVRTLSHPVNNDRNLIMHFPCPWNTNHKVHINSLPLPCWDLNRPGMTSRLKVFDLNLLAIGAFLHKLRNISLHTFPPIDLLQIMIHLCGTWINGIPGAMSLCNNIRYQIINIEHTKSALVSKNTIPQGE